MATILVVDDDRVILELCSWALVKVGGMDTLQAGGGDEAIDVARRHGGAIDLLLSDVVMPGGINGVRLAEILVVSRPAMKVLLMSGSSNDGIAAHPDWQFIWKPFQPVGLVSKIQETLGQRIPPGLETGLSTPLGQAGGKSIARGHELNTRRRS
jgi:DNA-binding NtrC family response regulator